MSTGGLDRARLEELREAYRRGLLEDNLPFWLPGALSDTGGYGCFLDREGRRYDTDKSVWHQGRFAWLLGTVARTVEPRAEWVEGCEHGVRFLREHCVDPADGRMWFHLDGDNRPLRKRRYVYSEAFAAQAFAAHAALTGDARSAEEQDALAALARDAQGVCRHPPQPVDGRRPRPGVREEVSERKRPPHFRARQELCHVW